MREQLFQSTLCPFDGHTTLPYSIPGIIANNPVDLFDHVCVYVCLCLVSRAANKRERRVQHERKKVCCHRSDAHIYVAHRRVLVYSC